MSEKRTPAAPVGRRLYEARRRLGMSQKSLGILAGIDEFSASPRINQYERGKHVPDFATARRLAQAVGVPVTYLYAEEDDLAELIVEYHRANKKKRTQALRILIGG